MPEPLILRMSGERLLALLAATLCALLIICITVWAVIDRQRDAEIEKDCLRAGGQWERVTDTWLSCNGTRKEA